MHTDASHRYERGVDPQLQRDAMERATTLLTSIVGGDVGPIIEAVAIEHVPQATDVVLREARLAKIIGISIATETVTEILTRLGFGVDYNNAQWSVSVPAYRFDISIEEDLIEEVARVYGYNNIPNVAPTASLNMRPADETQLPLNALKQVLLQQGYDEAITYSFVDPKKQSALFSETPTLTLPHPISADMSVMRVSLVTGLLQALGYNQKRQQARVRLFETGLRFVANEQSPSGVEQTPMIAAVCAGTVLTESWQEATAVDFFSVKGDVERLIAKTATPEAFSFAKSERALLHPGQGADILKDGQVVGFVGALHPQFAKTLGVNAKVFMFEIEQAALTGRVLPKAQAISKFPTNKRDIAIVVKDNVSYADIVSCIEKVGVNQLVDLTLFDIYKGEGIADGEKSLAVSLIFSDPEKTLEEAEIQACVDQVVSGLKSQLAATLRE